MNAHTNIYIIYHSYRYTKTIFFIGAQSPSAILSQILQFHDIFEIHYIQDIKYQLRIIDKYEIYQQLIQNYFISVRKLENKIIIYICD